MAFNVLPLPSSVTSLKLYGEMGVYVTQFLLKMYARHISYSFRSAKKKREIINLRLGARLMVVHFFFGQNKCIIYGQEKSGSEDHREASISDALKTLITHHFTRA